jgi:hypothetical protein
LVRRIHNSWPRQLITANYRLRTIPILSASCQPFQIVCEQIPEVYTRHSTLYNKSNNIVRSPTWSHLFRQWLRSYPHSFSRHCLAVRC